MAGVARFGAAGFGVVWRGEVWFGWQGLVWRGMVGRGMARRGLVINDLGGDYMVQEMKYSWKYDKYPVSAEVAANAINAIKAATGNDYVEPADLLDCSRAYDAPLHCCFEWDDVEAAEQYRLVQARDILRNIVVVFVEDPTPPPVRAFVNISTANSTGKFVDIQTAMVNGDYRRQLLLNALTELLAFKRKYEAYSELSQVFAAIDELKL